MLDTVGPLSMLPVLLAALGAIFTAAGVGDVISGLVSGVIPQGNAVVGVVVYASAWRSSRWSWATPTAPSR